MQCDREVLRERMPRVYRFLNHQILDVSSFLGVLSRWLPEKREFEFLPVPKGGGFKI